MRFRGLANRVCRRPRLRIACGAVALLAASAAPVAHAAVPADSVGIYSEELERTVSAYPVAEGRATPASGSFA